MYAIGIHIAPRYKSPLSLLESLLSFRSWHALRTHDIFQLGRGEPCTQKNLSCDKSSYNGHHIRAHFSYSKEMAANVSVLAFGDGDSIAWWLSCGIKFVMLETEK